MMPKFNVAITQILEYLVPVQAANESEAERIAETKFRNSVHPFDDYGVAIRVQEIEGVNRGWD